MAEQCAAVIADFAWWSQTCREPSVTTVREDGVEWPVCATHAPTPVRPVRDAGDEEGRS